MSQIEKKLAQRFVDLEAQGKQIPVLAKNTKHAEPFAFYSWAGSSLNLMQGIFGESSPHYKQFQSELARISNNYIDERHYHSFIGIFQAAKNDFEGGFIFEVERQVAGEMFGDLVALAKVSLAEGHHTVALVLASAALEDALKRYARSLEIDVEDRTMEQVVNALKTKGVVTGAQKALLSAMPKVRNHAMHADWEKLTPQDAGSVIGFVEAFLLSNFS